MVLREDFKEVRPIILVLKANKEDDVRRCFLYGLCRHHCKVWQANESDDARFCAIGSLTASVNGPGIGSDASSTNGHAGRHDVNREQQMRLPLKFRE